MHRNACISCTADNQIVISQDRWQTFLRIFSELNIKYIGLNSPLFEIFFTAWPMASLPMIKVF